MTSNIILYRSVPISDSKNFVIEDIDSFLVENNFDKIEITNFQYIRNSLELSIKVNLSQTMTEAFLSNNYNYALIRNQDDNTHYKRYYYFITNRKQIAESTIQLDLRMDTLNTFTFGVDYQLNKKTNVLREHKDRFVPVIDGGITKLQRRIDFYSEGINVPLYKDEEYTLTTSEGVDWYLIYKNRTDATLDDPQPIDCYLAPSTSLEIYYTAEPIINSSDLDSGNVYVFSTAYNSFSYELTFAFEGGSFSTSWNQNPSAPRYEVIVVELDTGHTGKVKISKYLYVYNTLSQSWSHTLISSVDNLSQIVVSGFPSNYINLYKGTSLPTGIYEGGDNYDFDFSDATVLLNSFESVDRTDILLNKIIALPYAPFNVEIDESNRLITPEEWEYDAGTGLLKLRNINSKLKSHIDSNIVNFVKEVYEYMNISPDVDEERNNMYESKLFHSDYYQYKFVYDSFAFVFRLETLNPEEYQTAGNFEFDFFMTSSMNSRFLFSFEWLDLIYSTEDFDKILPVARNNEVVIFSSAYLNYLRTSYNYDVKAKERTINSAYLGFGLNITGQAANIGLSAVNPALMVKAGIGAVSSISSSFINTINNVANAEDNFNKNIDLLKAQSISVMGSDDLDIMQEYCKNKGKLIGYRCSNRIEDLLFDLFYYTGYKTEETKVPNIKTRYWFNFLQCEAVIEDGEKVQGIPPRPIGLHALTTDIIEDLTMKFAEGITFFHNHSDVWNIEQTKENWEVSLL